MSFRIKYNNLGAILKSNLESELIYTGKDCDIYSKKYGKGTSSFKSLYPAFSITFDNNVTFSSNYIGYELDDYDCYYKMPMEWKSDFSTSSALMKNRDGDVEIALLTLNNVISYLTEVNQ